MKFKLLKIVFFFFLPVIMLNSCVNFFKRSDLRTEFVKSQNDAVKAKVLLQEMAKAHGLIQWKTVDTYQVKFEDEFFGFFGKKSNPFKENKVQFLLSYIPKSYDGNLKFLSGKYIGTTWGIQSWQTYVQEAKKALVFKKHKKAKFWLPTYQYFIEFPMRIQNATALAYAGEETIDGVLCEGVLAFWKSTKPQKDIDQYLIWINKKTKRIYKLVYTIREKYKFLEGAAYFKNYKNYDGILLPSSLPVTSNLSKKGFLHEMRILDFTINTVDKTSLRPNQNLPIYGDDKED